MEAVAAPGFPHDPAVRTEVSPVVAMPSVTVRVGGCEIEVAPGFDAGLLRDVCRALACPA